MFISQLFKHLYLKGTIRTTLPFPTPKANPFPSTFSSKYSSTTSQKHSFTVSYLVNNRGFSPETALKTSKLVRFNTAQKPNTVIAFFRSHGFSDSQINSIVRRAPNVLTCDPNRRVLPKFEFLCSKGASSSEIVEVVNRCPRILYSSLENSIIPTFELDSNITYVLRRSPSVIVSRGMRKVVDELKEMGFETSKINFVIALQAKRAVSKSRWDAKVVAFKSWGWSEELVLHVFRRCPLFMLSSEDKINKVMRFWVDRLGWDSLALARKPVIFGFSLEKRIIPRALVVQYLLTKGLRKKSASLLTPFFISEKAFLEKYVKYFKEEEEELLKLYQEKMSDPC
ncbi:Mitochodrial transcription termination factor-related [Spatholobus suberectus]|nr:Mitochodrial transcription termination factor-related [Spatholobus suberectus]